VRSVVLEAMFRGTLAQTSVHPREIARVAASVRYTKGLPLGFTCTSSLYSGLM
jgi:hypothetical protein